ncbi:hypothetical protein [Streptomyces niveus]|uniref:hypothetical protein n=1 Tax=Streptomyces niveus TaxID=193462 RepID=UPI00379EC8A0
MNRSQKPILDKLAALAALGMEWAGAVPAPEAAPEPAPPAAPTKRPQIDHHDECDKTLYAGGTCTCDLIEQYGPNSECLFSIPGFE